MVPVRVLKRLNETMHIRHQRSTCSLMEDSGLPLIGVPWWMPPRRVLIQVLSELAQGASHREATVRESPGAQHELKQALSISELPFILM